MKAKREKSPPEAVAANTEIKQEIYERTDEELSAQAAADAETAPLIQKVGATSIAEIDRVLAELEQAKDHLQSERERIEREVARYTNLTQLTSVTTKIIFDAVGDRRLHGAMVGFSLKAVTVLSWLQVGRPFLAC
jgi:hypothetical protein